MHHGRIAFLYTFCFICTAFTLSHVLNQEMPSIKTIVPLFWIPTVISQNASVDLGWHAPKKSWINDLGQVINGTGTNGFHFSGSQLSAGAPYGTYNWCNMPHVRRQEYPKANAEYELQYVEV
jgi:acid phosphatase